MKRGLEDIARKKCEVVKRRFDQANKVQLGMGHGNFEQSSKASLVDGDYTTQYILGIVMGMVISQFFEGHQDFLGQKTHVFASSLEVRHG